MKKTEELLKMPSLFLCTHCEQRKGKGEDNFSYSFRNSEDGFFAVFDGCGGLGAKKYSKANNKTGAKIASELAAASIEYYYDNHGFLFDNNDSRNVQILLSYCFKNTKLLYEEEHTKKIIGDLFRNLPTTVSTIAIKASSDSELSCEFIWAGDSRGLILDSNGLYQVTQDDIDTDEDAFSNLRNDSKHSNIVNADKDFVLHEKTVTVNKKEPSILITATDGCFGYFKTPMEFEYVILKSLVDSNELMDWKENIENMIIPYTGDDFTLIAMVYGINDLNECKSHFSNRVSFLFDTYVKKIPQASEKELLRMWESYKRDYYRW